MAIKKLQNDYTSPSQSKRLLKLGLPADSANLGIVDDIMHGGVEILQVPYSQWCKGYESISTPSWSAGRLMEIWDICVYLMPGMQLDLNNKPGNSTYIEYIIDGFELAADDSLIDFSQLEE